MIDYEWELDKLIDDVDAETAKKIQEYFEQRVKLLQSDVKKTLESLAREVVPVKGYADLKEYLRAMDLNKLDIPDNETKRKLREIWTNLSAIEIYKALKTRNQPALVNDQQADEQYKGIVAESQPVQKVQVSYQPSYQRIATAPRMTGSYDYDDEEYVVKSKYVHPSPFGVEEGYPPLIKKKKKPVTEY